MSDHTEQYRGISRYTSEKNTDKCELSKYLILAKTLSYLNVKWKHYISTAGKVYLIKHLFMEFLELLSYD